MNMNSRKTKVALCGISHVSNFGCEAIIRSTCTMLREILPDCDIIYASRDATIDKKILKDMDIQILQLSRRPDFLSRVINKALEVMRLRARISYDRYHKLCKLVDVIFSVGGDIYTVEKKLQQNKNYRCFNRMVQLEEYAKRHGCKIILYGASVGPFPQENGNEEYFKKHLAKTDLIICRELDSIYYLKSLGIMKQVLFSPDPAFFLCPKVDENLASERSGIAVNISRRILSLNIPEKVQIIEIAKLLVDISHRLNEPIYLLPHVYSNTLSDDDFSFMQEVMACIPDEDRFCIKLKVERDGFLAAKDVLRQRKMAITARMHCGINAISEAIPTIFISYSQKSIGMTELVYGTHKWVIGSDQIFDQLPLLSEEMYTNLAEIEGKLAESMREIRRTGSRFNIEKRILEIING